MTTFLATIVGAAALCVAGEAPPATEPIPAHLIIATKSIEALPTDIAPLFHNNVEAFQKAVREPATDWPRDSKLRVRNRWHHVEADAAATEPGRDARLEAARAFPRDQAAALRVYRNTPRDGGGTLPWAIEECFRDLVKAFESGREPDILSRAGYLAHFAADAADLCRGTADLFKGGNNPAFGSPPQAHSQVDYGTVRERIGVALMNRKSAVYAAEVIVTQPDYTPVVDPVEAAFDAVIDSLSVFDDAAAADREVLAELDIDNRRTFDDQREAYLKAMDDRVGRLCIERLFQGAKLSAGLIGGAWQAAGQPTLESIRLRGTVVSSEPAAAGRPVGPFVGSKNSIVFHTPECTFVKQISDENVVTFQSALDARQAGRRACKHCQAK